MGILIKVKGDCCALLTNVYKIRETCRDFFFFGVFLLFPHSSHLRKKRNKFAIAWYCSWFSKDGEKCPKVQEEDMR